MKKKQLQNQAQEGRSMVEMLGVLAVIGVISIGGIAGYRMAMNRYQANQIANEINLMRTDAKMKVARGVELLLGEPYDGEDGHLNFNANYGVTVKFEEIGTDTPGETETGYSFTLSNIPEGVCKPLVTLLDNMDDTAALEINGKDYETTENPCDNEENEVVVAFSTKDLGVSGGGNSDPEVTDPDQGDEPQECDPETCPGTCNDEGVCECPEGSHLKGDECVSCSGGKVWDGNDCSCPAGAEKSEDGEECACSTEKPHWTGTECTACPEGSKWNSETGECECEDGKVWKESKNGCVEIAGECESNADCGPGEYCYMYLGYQCYDDKEFDPNKFGGYSTHKSECRNARGDIEKEGADGKFVLGKAKKDNTDSSSGYMNWWSAERFCEALGRPQAKRASIGCDGVAVGSNCQSEIRKKLYEDFGSGYVWLYDMYDSSCNAYGVHLTNGGVVNNHRDGNAYALCE